MNPDVERMIARLACRMNRASRAAAVSAQQFADALGMMEATND